LSFNFLSSTEPNWGLPLAIAAHLHVPYRIDIGTDSIDSANVEDKRGKGKNQNFVSFPRVAWNFSWPSVFPIALLPSRVPRVWFDRQSRNFAFTLATRQLNFLIVCSACVSHQFPFSRFCLKILV
jgi:hypothetical protein